ncbi:MAG: ATP-binding cassette domain-containing protein [Candidatus Brocadiia bacterium]
MPNGYETYVTKAYSLDGISNLSGGEYRKIAIARALYRKAKLLVLDEPTASFDPKSEESFYRWLFGEYRNTTIILITHRLHAARMADRILHLRSGRLVEEGPHHELASSGGSYAKLFRMQARLYASPKSSKAGRVRLARG